MSSYIRQNRVPLPPPDAKVTTTACDYCVVACGYKVYTWPVGKEGGPKAAENAFNVDFPTSTLGWWISPNQHNIVSVNGQPHHVLVVPDNDATVVNLKGNYSIRGGTNALKAYNPDTPTRDRLLYPQIRVDGKLERVSWDTALDVMVAVSKHVLSKYGEMAWAMKTYSYEFFENTYAITKLAWGSINTAAFAQHDKPGMSSDTGGMDDAGIITFSASYKDYAAADVLFISGTDPFETKTVVFTSWMLGKKLIMVVPRRTAGVAYAEQNGGLHLPVIPGTDTILHLAINRIILENGWEDKEFIDRWVANSWEVDAGFGRGPRNTPWQWRTTWGQFQSNYKDYKEWLLKYEPAELEKAAATTGVPAEKIRKAAEMLTGAGGPRPKASFNFEKGNYWSHNYLNTASLAALGLLCGAGNRPGRVISRLGGHQRGWMAGAAYPMDKTPEKLPGRRRNQLDLDRWVMDGHVRFAWVIGNTWTGGQAASQFLAAALRRFTRENPNQVTSTNKDEIIATLLARVDSGGMVIVDSDIYPVEPINTELADIVLPAAQWGEHDVTRCNGERRLRLYSRFYDPPARRNLTGGRSPSSPSGWATRVTTGRMATTCSRRLRASAAVLCSTTIRWCGWPSARASAHTICCASTVPRASRHRSATKAASWSVPSGCTTQSLR
jgi:arsenite oxidase large subunit